MRHVYFDHSATTPVAKEVSETVLEYMLDKFGNPSSVHWFGRESAKAVRTAREQIARLIGAHAEEIIFTSGGTEGDNLALKGIALANQKKGKHIITSAIEHHAVLHTCEFLEKMGYEITYLPVDEYGMVRVDDVEKAVKNDTILISIMFANNEVGTLQPIKEIGNLARERGIYFHTDAVQAVGNYPLNVDEYNIDLMTMSGHKFYAPKGIGALYIRKGVKITSIQQGGAQERNLRAGTENVPGIVGMGKAAELAYNELEERVRHVSSLRDILIEGIQKKIPNVKLNGHRVKRMPGNVNFSFVGVEGEALLLSLDIKGIAASSGSACTSGSLDPSHVLLAMGISHEVAHGSLRISLGRKNTLEDVQYCLEVLPGIIERLRSMSALDGNNVCSKSGRCTQCHRHG